MEQSNHTDFLGRDKDADITTLQAKCDRYEKALFDLRYYALSCSNDGNYIDHDSIIEQIDEALNGEGEKVGLSRKALELELWNMLPDECRKILAPIKKSYIESMLADIDSYFVNKQGKL